MPDRSAPSQHRGAVCKKCEAVKRHIITERHLDGAHFERIVRDANPQMILRKKFGAVNWEPGVWKRVLVCRKCATATPHK